MSLDALKREAAALDEQSRKELFSYLVTLREERWTAYARTAARNLDDPDPARWLTPEEFKTRLEQFPEPPPV
jgi:hypothetical protein